MWTQFWDMHSGGGTKEAPYNKIYIEAPKEKAKIIFFNRFGHNPERVTCTCCGEDYSISEEPDLEQLTAFHRGCDYVYRNAKGEVVDECEAWKPGKGLQKGYTGGYEETQGKFSTTHCSLAEYCKHEDVLVIRDSQIKAKERALWCRGYGHIAA